MEQLNKNFVCIKNGVVDNVLILPIEGLEELKQAIQQEKGYSELVEIGDGTNYPATIGIGYTWENQEFRPPKEYPSWVWDAEDGTWVSPVGPIPQDGKTYKWDENEINWVETL